MVSCHSTIDSHDNALVYIELNIISCQLLLFDEENFYNYQKLSLKLLFFSIYFDVGFCCMRFRVDLDVLYFLLFDLCQVFICER